MDQQSQQQMDSKWLNYGDVKLDLESSAVFLKDRLGGDQSVSLTPLEFRILAILLQTPNKIISRDQILESVWGKDVFVVDRTVDTHISNLRKKLGSKELYIRSVYGAGYRLEKKASFFTPTLGKPANAEYGNTKPYAMI
jgi:DNA-binding response OmpR family regulator